MISASNSTLMLLKSITVIILMDEEDKDSMNLVPRLLSRIEDKEKVKSEKSLVEIRD